MAIGFIPEFWVGSYGDEETLAMQGIGRWGGGVINLIGIYLLRKSGKLSVELKCIARLKLSRFQFR